MNILEKIASFLTPKPINSFYSTQTKDQTVPNFSGHVLSPLFYQIKEYTTLKKIYGQNSESVILNKTRVQAVDCKVLSTLFEDACRYKAIAKVHNDNFIFIRRAVDVRQKFQLEKQALEKSKLGGEIDQYVEQARTSADFEVKIASSKINKVIVNKLIYTHTKRLLKIIGY